MPSMKFDFSDIRAPEMLKTDTVRKMCAPARQPRRGMKRILVCAAACALVLVMISAGARMFDYLAYVPGRGIATVSREGVYTLEKVVRMGSYTIDGVSFVPEAEGTAVTVSTDKPFYHRDETIVSDTMTLTAADGSSVVLQFSYGTNSGSTYCGLIEDDTRPFAGTLTLSWHGDAAELHMIPLERSPYADCAYPICDGLTLVAFPTAEGSKRIVFGVELDPESENFAYWASVADRVTATPRLTAIDSAGNEYVAHSYTGHYVCTEMQDYFGCSENYAILDRVPEAPITAIRVDGLQLHFMDIDRSARNPVTVTVPQNGETVMEQITLLADHGITLVTESVSAGVDSEGKPELSMQCPYPTLAFDEAVTEVIIWLSYAAPDADIADPASFYGGGAFHAREENAANYHCRLAYETKGKERVFPQTYDDAVHVYVHGIDLELDQTWVIAFADGAGE